MVTVGMQLVLRTTCGNPVPTLANTNESVGMRWLNGA